MLPHVQHVSRRQLSVTPTFARHYKVESSPKRLWKAPPRKPPIKQVKPPPPPPPPEKVETPNIPQESEIHKQRLYQHSLGQADGFRGAYISLWADAALSSIQDALCVIRTLEMKYGEIAQFRFVKDPSRPKGLQYLRDIYILFKSPRSLERIPEDGDVVHIRLPYGSPASLYREGGVGLDEIEDLLNPGCYDPDFSSDVDDMRMGEPGTSRLDSAQVEVEVGDGDEGLGERILAGQRPRSRYVDARVTRLRTPFVTTSPIVSVRKIPPSYAENFIAFGGFAKLDPIPNDLYIHEETLESMRRKGEEIRHPNMHLAIQKQCRLVGAENKWVYDPKARTVPSAVEVESRDSVDRVGDVQESTLEETSTPLIDATEWDVNTDIPEESTSSLVETETHTQPQVEEPPTSYTPQPKPPPPQPPTPAPRIQVPRRVTRGRPIGRVAYNLNLSLPSTSTATEELKARSALSQTPNQRGGLSLAERQAMISEWAKTTGTEVVGSERVDGAGLGGVDDNGAGGNGNNLPPPVSRLKKLFGVW